MNKVFEYVIKNYEDKDLIENRDIIYKKLKICDLDFSTHVSKNNNSR